MDGGTEGRGASVEKLGEDTGVVTAFRAATGGRDRPVATVIWKKCVIHPTEERKDERNEGK